MVTSKAGKFNEMQISFAIEYHLVLDMPHSTEKVSSANTSTIQRTSTRYWTTKGPKRKRPKVVLQGAWLFVQPALVYSNTKSKHQDKNPVTLEKDLAMNVSGSLGILHYPGSDTAKDTPIAIAEPVHALIAKYIYSRWETDIVRQSSKEMPLMLTAQGSYTLLQDGSSFKVYAAGTVATCGQWLGAIPRAPRAHPWLSIQGRFPGPSQ